jgi:hypothetical protein
MALVILSIVAAGLILPFAAGATVQQEGNKRTLASKLACDLMEKIVNTNFDDIVSEYNGYSESQGQVEDASGQVFTDVIYSKFSRQAACQYVYVPQQAAFGTQTFISVTVSVYNNGSKLAELTQIKSR